jgi:hypothetical protein
LKIGSDNQVAPINFELKVNIFLSARCKWEWGFRSAVTLFSIWDACGLKLNGSLPFSVHLYFLIYSNSFSCRIYHILHTTYNRFWTQSQYFLLSAGCKWEWRFRSAVTLFNIWDACGLELNGFLPFSINFH